MPKLTNSLFVAAAVLAGANAIALPAFAAATSQSADEFRTSQLVGTKVFNSAGDNIGNIEDIVLKPDGSLDAVVISVGGFLGIGDKYVAVPFDNLKISRDSAAIKIVTEGTKESLKALPAYQFYKS